MTEDAAFESLAREFKSAGGSLMRYADLQVLKSREFGAIERMAARKRRQANTIQICAVLVILAQIALVTPEVMERGWFAAAPLPFWAVLAGIILASMQSTKRNLAESMERLRVHLEGRA